MLPWSNWIVPAARGTDDGDEGEAASLHRPFDNPHDASENTARMGDKAKPSGVSERRRLCCLSGHRGASIAQSAGAVPADLMRVTAHSQD
jgi:hypothetical protein